MSPGSKAARVWKRTWVGASIAGALALVLWLASALDSSTPVLVMSCAILAACVWEVSRMGAFTPRRFALVLGLAGAIVALCVGVALWYVEHESTPQPAASVCHAALASSSWVAFAVVLGGFALLRSDSGFVRACALLAVFANLVAVPASNQAWIESAALVLLLFLVARFVVLGGSELRRETITVVALGVLLAVSIPGFAVAWAAFDHWGLVALIAIAKLGDTAAYYTGHAIGKHHPFPRISPGKTAEGCVASLLAGTLGGVICVVLGMLPREPIGLVGGALGGAVVNVAAQIGDLLESWVKRMAGVKDSGTWFGPSGGMLDLVDSFLVATPVALAAWPVVFDFPPVWAFGGTP